MMMTSLIAKKVGGQMIITTLVFGFLIGSSWASKLSDFQKLADCDFADVKELAKVKFRVQNGIFSSPFETVQDMLKECQILSKATSCAKILLKTLPSEYNKMFEAITGGKQTLFQELCDGATETHRKFVDSFDCMKNVIKETSECQEKFSLSQKLIQDELEDYREKTFFSCCAYEWRKDCIVRIATEICGQDTSAFVDNMVVTEVGDVLSKLCVNDVGNCHGRLYGVDDGSRLKPSLAAWILLATILWVYRWHRD